MPTLAEQLAGAFDPFEEALRRVQESALVDRARIATLENKVAELRKALDRQAPANPTPSPIPSLLPNVEINVGGVLFRPAGPGEEWPLSDEIRWFWDYDSEVRVILDVLRAQQVRVILQRCWDDRKDAAPMRTLTIMVTIDGEVYFEGPVRIHNGTRPAMTFRRIVPSIEGNVFDPAALPNYDDALAGFGPDIVEDIANPPNWYWRRWSDVSAHGSFDPWSEDYGFVVNSWTGGAAPSANEASMLPPWDVAWLLSNDSRLGELCLHTADTSGNYAVHWYQRETGRSHTYETAGALPFTLVETNLPSAGLTIGGKKAPTPDLAHCPGLTNLAALITGERYYVEELEAWNLVGTLCKKPAERANGIYFSGQVRATAWWLRNLFHLAEAYGATGGELLNADERGEFYSRQLTNNLIHCAKLTTSAPSGILGRIPVRDAPMTKYRHPDAKEQVSTGNLHFLLHVLSQIQRAGYSSATPAIDALIAVPRSLWLLSPNLLLVPWFQHAYVEGGWAAIITATFHTLPAEIRDAKTWKETPLTSDYIGWYRAALVAAVERGHLWAIEALQWMDRQLEEEGRKLPLGWAIRPHSVLRLP